MTRAIHFEIHAADVPRCVNFYREAFGWEIQDWSDLAGAPYFGVTTGLGGLVGMNGAIMQRMGDNPPPGSAVMGSVLTFGTDDFDTQAQQIMDAGGQVALAKFALPGMSWQGYFLDTEGNVFGIHQPDPNAV